MPNQAKNIEKAINDLKDMVIKEVNDKLPRKVGVLAVNHFRDNFRKGGFVNGGLKPWQKTIRQSGKGTDASYGPLTSARDHLMSSIEFKAEPGKVLVRNPVEYAKIHNEGGYIPVTMKMKGYFWHRYFELAGKGKDKMKTPPPEAEMWKNMALTNRSRIKIPKRQFIGDSQELRDRITKEINKTLNNISNGITSYFNH